MRLILKLIGPALCLVLVTFAAGSAAAQVGLYDVFESQVLNDRTYTNPFDFREIELTTAFTAPSGKTYAFFGFFDGDGLGGQSGNVWRIRFMPNETGIWTYTYGWSDGLKGSAGSFKVVDTGLRGPLQRASDNGWYFMDSRTAPFHFRGLGYMGWHQYDGREIIGNRDALMKDLQADIDAGYNAFMLSGRQVVRNNSESWWYGGDKSRFSVAQWAGYEEILAFANERGSYIFPFTGMILQGEYYAFEQFQLFLRYWVARLAPYASFFGYSITWEWSEVLSEAYVNQVMKYIRDITPWPTLLSVHDGMRESFAPWMGFSMRQNQSNRVSVGNCRTCGQYGGVPASLSDRPIIATEDIWEYVDGEYGQPSNALEVQRGAWGIMLAGVMPLYSEWGFPPGAAPIAGKGTGKPRYRIMLDFVMGQTNYRSHERINGLLSGTGTVVGSGLVGYEYLAYREGPGSITVDLAGSDVGTTFIAIWLDPATGTQQSGPESTGGGVVTLTSPYTGDAVLVLRDTRASLPPLPPSNLQIK